LFVGYAPPPICSFSVDLFWQLGAMSALSPTPFVRARLLTPTLRILRTFRQGEILTEQNLIPCGGAEFCRGTDEDVCIIGSDLRAQWHLVRAALAISISPIAL